MKSGLLDLFKISNTTNKKYLWSFFRAVVIAKLIIAVLLLIMFFVVKIQTVQRYSSAQLEQIGTQLNLLYDTLEAIRHQILSNRDTNLALNAVEIDRLQEFSAQKQLRAISSGHPHIRYVGFYNSITDRYLTNTCVADGETFDPAFLYELLGGRRFMGLRRSVGASYATQSLNQINVYTFIFSLYRRGDVLPNLIILDIDASYLDNVVNNLRTYDTQQQVVFLDNAENIVSFWTAERAEVQLTIADPLVDHLNGNFNLPDAKSLLRSFHHTGFYTYYYASRIGWYIVQRVPIVHLLSDLVPVAVLALSLWFISLVFGYLLSKRVSNSLYKPIRSLYEQFVFNGDSDEEGKRNELEQLSYAFSDMYDKVNDLEQGLINAYNQSKRQYLNYLFEGEVERITSSSAIYNRLHIRLDSPFYAVAVIECFPRRRSFPDNSLFILPFELERISVEILGNEYETEFSRVWENTFAVLIYMNENELSVDLYDKLEAIIRTVEGENLADIAICIGNVCSSWQSINVSFEQAVAAIKSRPLHLSGRVFTCRDESVPIRADQYFNGLHKKFTEYVRERNINACEQEFDTALRYMGSVSVQMAKAYFQHVAFSVLDDFAAYFDKDDESTRALLTLLEQIDGIHNIRELRLAIIDFLEAMSHRFDIVRKPKSSKAAEQTRYYIEENYNDPDLSLDSLAHKLDLTPAYLGKNFSLHTGMSFNSFLTRIRMNKAAELLVDTRKPVKKIGEEVGVINTSYFYSLFKKQYQMTPVQYRESQKRLTSASEANHTVSD